MQDNYSSEPNPDDVTKITEEAKIFGKHKSKTLTKQNLTSWQQAINEEAGILAAESPIYLTNRGNDLKFVRSLQPGISIMFRSLLWFK